MDEWPWHAPNIITVPAIKWLYGIGISLYVCGLLFVVVISRSIFKTLPLLKWTWLPVTEKTPSFLTTKLKLKATCAFQFMCKYIVVKLRFIYELQELQRFQTTSDLQTQSRSSVIMTLDSSYMIFYLSSIVTISLSCTVFGGKWRT